MGKFLIRSVLIFCFYTNLPVIGFCSTSIKEHQIIDSFFVVVVVTKYHNKCSLRKDVFILAYILRIQSIMLGRHGGRSVRQLVKLQPKSGSGK